MNCIEEAKRFAKENKKAAYEIYLNASSTIEDPTDPDQCGSAKEYFGFHKDDPDEDKVCEEIFRLRNARDFSRLDEFLNYDGDSSTGGGAVLKKPKPATYSNTIGKIFRQLNFRLSHSANMLDASLAVIDSIECGGDITGISETACASSMTIAGLAVGAAWMVAQVISDNAAYAYSEKFQLNDQQMDEIYQNLDVVYDNMVEIYEKLEEIETLQRSQSVRNLEEIAGGDPPTVTCSFRSGEASEFKRHIDGQEMFIEQDDVHLVDTFYDLKIQVESSLAAANMEVVVESNEFERNSAEVVLAHSKHESPLMPDVFIKPKPCKSLRNHEFCKTDPETSVRFYNIVAKVADAWGNASNSTCTVIVVPKGELADVVGKSSKRVLGRKSLDWTKLAQVIKEDVKKLTKQYRLASVSW